MEARRLLAQVLDEETASQATYEDCVELLDGALRLGVVVSDELQNEVIEFLCVAFADDAPEPWPNPRVGLLVNGYDGPRELWQYSLPDARFMRPPLRQDAHVIELAANWFQRKETTVTDGFTGNKEFVEVEKHESPEGVEIAPEEVAGMLEVAVIESIWELGEEGLATRTVRQLKAMCRLLSCRIGGKKADIVARLADLARLEPMQEAVAGDCPMSIAAMLPALKHRTSDGRWYLEGHRLFFTLTLEDGREVQWDQKGLCPDKWVDFKGTVRKAPAVMASRA